MIPGSHGVLDLLGQQVQRVVVDLTALTCPAHAADHLLAAEWFGHTAALDDGQYRGFDGAESATTLRARAAAPDGLPLVRLAGVDDSGIGVPTERTMHGRSFAALTSGCPKPPRAYLRARLQA